MSGSANGLAYLALILWCPLCLVCFTSFRPATAAAVCFVGAALLLPANFGFEAPVLTLLDKELLPPLFALLGCAMFQTRRLAAARVGRGPEVLLGVMMVGMLGTSLTNGDQLQYGPRVIPGEGPYDAFVSAIDVAIRFGVPFVLGRSLIRRVEDLREVFVVMAVGAVFYSLLAVYELRMGPHLNDILYGYHQSDFSQTIRGSGFRPKIFMRHGLNVTLFFAFVVIVLRGMVQARHRPFGVPAAPVFAYLGVMLVLCKSVAAVVYAAVGSLLLFVRSPRAMRAIAVVWAAVVFSYPVFRSLDWIPATDIIAFTDEHLGGERSRSIRARFENEAMLLERSRDRPLFGWGGYGRGRVYDPATGEDLSVTDGLWALEINRWGLWGYTCLFGLLLLPVVRAGNALPRIRSRRARLYVWSLTVLCATYVLDLVPNSSVSAYLTFLVGGLAGLVPGTLERERRDRIRARRAAESSEASDQADQSRTGASIPASTRV